MEEIKRVLDYEQLLERALRQVPKHVTKHERFEIPRARVVIIGTRTIIQNFKEICDILRREPRHLARFLLRELATAGDIEGDMLALQGKFSRSAINRLIKIYTESYVICPVCGSPDTRLVKEKRLMFLVCEACGARSSVRPLR